MLKINQLLGLNAKSKVPYLVGSSFVQRTSSNATITANIPTETKDGDLLIAFAGEQNASSVAGAKWSTPSGWTEVLDTYTVGIFYKIADQEGATVSLTSSSSSTSHAFVLAYRNANYDSVVNNLPAVSSFPTFGSLLVPTIPRSIIIVHLRNSSTASITMASASGSPVTPVLIQADSDGTAPSGFIYEVPTTYADGSSYSVNFATNQSQFLRGCAVIIKPSE